MTGEMSVMGKYVKWLSGTLLTSCKVSAPSHEADSTRPGRGSAFKMYAKSYILVVCESARLSSVTPFISPLLLHSLPVCSQMLLSLVSASFPFITSAAAAASSQPSLTLLPLFFFYIFCDSSQLFFFQSLPRPLTSPHLWSFLRLHLFILLQHLSKNFTFHTHLSLAFPGRTSVPTILLLSQCYTHLYHCSLCSPPSIHSYIPPLYSLHITRERVIEM